ncbi:hypothetical protein ACFLY6_02575 [Candidatus Dependentiae bacterium]
MKKYALLALTVFGICGARALDFTRDLFLKNVELEKRTFGKKVLKGVGFCGGALPVLCGAGIGAWGFAFVSDNDEVKKDETEVLFGSFGLIVLYTTVNGLLRGSAKLIGKLRSVRGFNWLNTDEKVDANTVRAAIENFDEIKDKLVSPVAELLENVRKELEVKELEVVEKTVEKVEELGDAEETVSEKVDAQVEPEVDPEEAQEPAMKLKRLSHSKALEVMAEIRKIVKTIDDMSFGFGLASKLRGAN